VLEQLRSHPHGIYLKGIRHQVHDESDPRWLLRDDVQRGIAAVGEAGLVYDLLSRTAELPACVETVARNAGMQFVLDHIAKPAMTQADNAAWYAQITELARYQNVACKLSGMVTEAGLDWTADHIRPFAEHVLTEFGDRRVLFGSDWPVSLIASDYAGVVALARDLVTGFDEAAQARIFGLNAVEIYRL
jgi:L-fuconolactonase